MPERRGFRPGLFFAAVAAALVGIVILGAATRFVPAGPVVRLGLVGLVVAGGVAVAAVKRRWDIAIAVAVSVVAFAIFIIWLTSNVVGNID